MPPRLLERAALSPPIPPLVIDPRALSPDHHLLHRLSGSQPTPLAAAVGQIRRAWPTYGALGTATHPTPTAAAAWSRVCAERWARPAQLGDAPAPGFHPPEDRDAEDAMGA